MDTASLLSSMHASLQNLDEVERYRVLSALLGTLADEKESNEGARQVSAEQVEALKERVQKLDHERASAVDELKIVQADLERAQKRLEDESAHGAKLKETHETQRARLEALQQENESLKAEVIGKNNTIHRLETENENITLRAQRAEHASTDRTAQERLEHEKNELIRELETVRAQVETLRSDKDKEIARLEDDVRAADKSAAGSGDEFLKTLWEPLAHTKPALVEGHVPPTAQSAERLVGAFIELALFVNRFDQGMHPFLTRYTRDHTSVKVPWDAYAKGDDLLKVTMRTIAPVGGRPVGVLKMRLRLLHQWTDAAMIGCDSAIESIASELETFIRGESGIANQPNRTLKEFLRDDGHELFMQHMREIRSKKLGDAFGRGG